MGSEFESFSGKRHDALYGYGFKKDVPRDPSDILVQLDCEIEHVVEQRTATLLDTAVDKLASIDYASIQLIARTQVHGELLEVSNAWREAEGIIHDQI